MKKFMLMAVAVLTLGLTSCKEEAKNDEAAAVIENLKNELESGDANAVQTTLQNAQEKIAELVAKDPEAAKTYVTKIQDFVKENKEKITAVVGENAATQTLVNALIDTPAETIINTLTVGQAVLDNAEKTAEGVKDSVNQALENKANEMTKPSRRQTMRSTKPLRRPTRKSTRLQTRLSSPSVSNHFRLSV